MDNYRFIQILQEISNSQNSFVSSLNNYINEVQSSGWNQYDPAYVQNLQNDNSNLNYRVNELTSNIGQLQNDIQMLQSQIANNSMSTSAEVDSLRSLVSSLTNDKDYLQSQCNAKDQQINDLTNSVLSLQTTIDSDVNTITDLNNTIANLNAQLSEAYNVINQKQSEQDALAQQNESFRLKLEQLKAKVAAELDEAQRDIDEALDQAGS